MRVHVTWSGWLVPRRLFAVLTVLVSALLVVSMWSAPAVATESPEQEAPSEGDDQELLSRPDRLSAALLARSMDKRVEVESARTESSRSFVNPDGTTTVEASIGMQSIRGDDGQWRDIDLSLVESADGTFSPAASPADLTVGGGDSSLVARVGLGKSRSLSVTWPSELPAPTVDGAIATYKVSGSMDLLVISTQQGASVRFRINERPSADDVALTLGLRAESVEVEEGTQNRLVVADGGKTLAMTAPMVAWDARVDSAGDPLNVVPVDPSLTEVSSVGREARHELELSPLEGFLADPETVFPVIVDPDIGAVSNLRDTMVRDGVTSVQGSDPRLWAGRLEEASSPNPWLTYVQWENGELSDKAIVKATAKLYQYSSGSCSARKIYAYALVDPFTAGSTVWSNRPDITTSYSSSTTAQGSNGGCKSKNGWVSFDVTEMVSHWADGSLTNRGIRFSISKTNSPDVTYTRRFCSGNEDPSHHDCNKAKFTPILSVTYDGPPTMPAGFDVQPSTATSASRWLTSSAKPKVSVPVADPEGQTVKARILVKQGASTVADVESAFVASGATAVKELPSLPDGEYKVQVRAYDSAGASSEWTSAQTLVVDTSAPAAPTVACTGYATGTWYDTRPAGSTTCSVTGGGDVVGFDWSLNGKPMPPVTRTGSSTSLGSFPIGTNGVFGVSVKAKDAAGNPSVAGEFGFGTGDAGLTTPVEGERTSTTVTVNANAPAGATWARVEYKTVDESTWTEATGLKVKGSWFPWMHLPTNVDVDTDSTGDVVWDMSAETGMKAPAVKQVRVCFVYSGVERCTPGRTVALVPSAFGGSFPTQAAGPGEVALFTGELAIDETDVSVPGYGGELSLGRSHHTFAGDASPAASVFGPGWVADLSGPDAGQAGLDVVDATATEAAISLIGPDGSSSTYVHVDDTASAQRVGVYEGVGETETDNDVLEIEDRSGTKYLTLTEEDGTVTEWKHLGDGQWVVTKVVEPFENSTTTFTHDTAGLVTGIYAPAPDGVTCNATTQDVGCRALQLTYTGTGASTRLTQVDVRIYNPAPGADGLPGSGAGMTTKTVAKYSYDSNNRLAASWDPRLGDGGSALKTSYEYDTAGSHTRLTKATPPGETPWRFAYDGVGRFSTVKRAHPSAVGSGDATWTVGYDVALSGTGLPDLSETAVKGWGQPAAPVGAAVVFGPDAPGTTDHTYGSISYWDAEGRTTNVASYGAGAWQVDSTGYDAIGNEVWALDEGNRNLALAANADSAAVAGTLATITTFNDAGTRVEKTVGPTRQVMLENGNLIAGRDLSTTVYDDEAASESVPTPGRPTPDPDAPALNLPVEERNAVVDVDGNVYDTVKIRYRYDPVVTGDGDGWVTGAATRTSVQLGSGWSTTLARFDTDGKLIETRTPQGVAAVDGTANDTRSRKSVYYTADASATVAACRNKPAWAGLECQSGPAGQPGTGESIPVDTTTGFDYLLNPTRVVETSGSMSRASVTGYDDAGRKTSDKLTVTGAPTGDQSIPDATYGYSASTGALTTVTAGSKTQTTTYDSWGRLLTQSDGNGNTGTTTYNTAARVASFNDGKGTYSYTYDGTDAAGKTERRGLVTAVDVGLASGPDVFKTASNADGQTFLTEYPNGMKAKSQFDAAGTETSLEYVADDGTEIVGFSNITNADGRVRYASSVLSEQVYSYDGRGRLTKVQDTDGSGCVTRQYSFSLDSNRESLTTSGPGTSGACTTSGGTTVTSSFDAADRITTTGYTYDKFGRSRTIPKAHTDQADVALAGDLSIAYYANDMVAKLSQTQPDDVSTVVMSKTFTLDPATRLASTEDATAGVALRQTVNHYADGGDAPAWITEKTRPDAATAWDEAWTRNVLGPDGDLAIIAPSTGTAKIQIANLHGDVVTQIDNTTGVPMIDAYVESTEYGLAKNPGTDLGQHYGWLGTKQRSTDSLGGLTLMGARLYNPVTGRFASMDPVYGGNDNTYAYPVDPINMFDLDGQWGVPKWAKKAARKAGSAAKKVGKVAWKYKYDIALTVVPGGGAIRGGMAAYKGYKTVRAGSKARKVAKNVCKIPNSFEPGTMVRLADGSSTPIEDIHVGDEVLAADPETGDATPESVQELIRGVGLKTLVTISVDSDEDGQVGSVVATGGHPFWVDRLGWINAEDLRVGDRLLSSEFNAGVIVALSTAVEQRRVYNLSVERLHTYYVEMDGEAWLVHNAGCGKKKYFSKTFKKRKTAVAKAKQVAKRTHGAKYRGPCKSGDHCHVDFKDGRVGHYRWPKKR